MVKLHKRSSSAQKRNVLWKHKTALMTRWRTRHGCACERKQIVLCESFSWAFSCQKKTSEHQWKRERFAEALCLLSSPSRNSQEDLLIKIFKSVFMSLTIHKDSWRLKTVCIQMKNLLPLTIDRSLARVNKQRNEIPIEKSFQLFSLKFLFALRANRAKGFRKFSLRWTLFKQHKHLRCEIMSASVSNFSAYSVTFVLHNLHYKLRSSAFEIWILPSL